MSGSASIASLKEKRAAAPGDDLPTRDRLRRLEMRVAREHAARHEAERLLESKSLELFELNRRLASLNAELEDRVRARTAELEQERQLAESLVATDYLTRVASRACFVQHLEVCLMQACETGSRIGLLLIDIDDFKQINDSLGHVYGDDLLISVARRLQQVSRNEEMVSRLGGDEFAVVFPCRGRHDALQIAGRFRTVFQQSFLASGVSVRSTGSMGVAIYPDDASTAAELQQYADLALYRVKSTRRGGLACFKRILLERFETRRTLERELRLAVETGNIDVWYQPIGRVSTGEVEGVEALARLKDTQGNFIPPDVFIPLAEHCDCIHDLGRLVLTKACQDAKAWMQHGRLQRLAVNLSAVQVQGANIASDVLRALESAGLDPKALDSGDHRACLA